MSISRGDGDLIAAIYDAAIDPSEWEDVVKRIVEATKLMSSGLLVRSANAAHLSASTISIRPLRARMSRRGSDPGQTRAWAPAAIDRAQKMRKFKDADRGSQPTPPVIPRFEVDDDPSGKIATFQPDGPTFTALNPFFQNLGTNGRTCFTCHQPPNGWSMSAASARTRFETSSGTDPLFRLVDGATCPTDDVSTLKAKREAYKLVIEKGLIRIGLPLPKAPDLQFKVIEVDDPYHCTTSKDTGLTSPTTGIVSVYRRPLPSTNLGFLSAIMFDGREPTLESQAVDATLGHAQAHAAPTADQVRQIVAFETGATGATGIFTAQVFDNEARSLHARNATGGPRALSAELSKFFIGVNDPLGLNPKGLPFNPNIFNLYKYWESLRDTDADKTEARKSIARGEELFNTTRINITGVSGLNDDLNMPSIAGFCGTCHDTPNIGNHSVKAPLDIGIADAGDNSPPALDIAGLPVFTLECTQEGPLFGKAYVVTDPGRALISGKCKDIGRVKGPILRGLAARALFSQRLGGHAARRGELLRPALQHRFRGPNKWRTWSISLTHSELRLSRFRRRLKRGLPSLSVTPRPQLPLS